MSESKLTYTLPTNFVRDVLLEAYTLECEPDFEEAEYKLMDHISNTTEESIELPKQLVDEMVVSYIHAEHRSNSAAEVMKEFQEILEHYKVESTMSQILFDYANNNW